MSQARRTHGVDYPRAIRVDDRVVRFQGEAALVDRALGPLATLEESTARERAAGDFDVTVEWASESTPRPPKGLPPEAAARFEAGPTAACVRAPGLGVAKLHENGNLLIDVDPSAPAGDAVGEFVTIPALAERMRREGIHLVHAAILGGPSPHRGAFLVPAASGGGKTTLSLSLRRHGWGLLSDDRGWLIGPVERAAVDPWPEAPRVGDRSLFLLPRYAAPGPRDERTGKASVPSLLPPRVDRPFRILGVLLPRLVDGSGGRVTQASGSEVLVEVMSQTVVATAPSTARRTMAFVAAMLQRIPAFAVEVGDDPWAVAISVEKAVNSASRELA